MSMVSLELRAHMREWLAWIGKYMGIGEAQVFSNVRPGRIDSSKMLTINSQELSIFLHSSVVDGYILI
jgi:hypothetical protein